MPQYNYEDEDDRYDGEEDDYEVDPEVAEAQMVAALGEVREIVGKEFKDDEIRDSLWHTYYDVGKTVNFLLSMCL